MIIDCKFRVYVLGFIPFEVNEFKNIEFVPLAVQVALVGDVKLVLRHREVILRVKSFENVRRI